jgi:hypothetical protein
MCLATLASVPQEIARRPWWEVHCHCIVPTVRHIRRRDQREPGGRQGRRQPGLAVFRLPVVLGGRVSVGDHRGGGRTEEPRAGPSGAVYPRPDAVGARAAVHHIERSRGGRRYVWRHGLARKPRQGYVHACRFFSPRPVPVALSTNEPLTTRPTDPVQLYAKSAVKRLLAFVPTLRYACPCVMPWSASFVKWFGYLRL